VWSWG